MCARCNIIDLRIAQYQELVEIGIEGDSSLVDFRSVIADLQRQKIALHAADHQNSRSKF